MQDNRFVTTHQTIQSISAIPAGQEYEGKTDPLDRIAITGQLLYQRNKQGSTDPEPRGRSRFLPWANRPPTEPVLVLNYRILLHEQSEDEFGMDVEIEDVPGRDPSVSGVYDRIILTYAMADDEQVFGLGEQFSYWTLKGLKVPILSREQGIGRGMQPISFVLNHVPPKDPGYSGGDPLTTYTAIAHYITSQGRSVYLHNSELSVFDFSEPTRASIQVVSRRLRKTVFAGTRPLDLIRTYTSSISGRQRMLPDWVSGGNGAIVGVQGGEEKVMKVVKTLKARGVPVAAVWLQDWVGQRVQPFSISFPIPFLIPGFPNRSTATVTIKSTNTQKRLWWNWEHDRGAYPNWPEFVKRLREDHGVRVMSYINPFLSDVETGGKPAHTWSRNYFKEASELGYLVKRWTRVSIDSSLAAKQNGDFEDGEWKLVDYLISSGPGLNAGMIDLSNPDAFEWYKKLIKDNMIALGASGWMADFAEYLPFDCVLHSQMNMTRPPGERDDMTASSQYFASPPEDPKSFHNVYPREWARLNREAVDEMGQEAKREVVFFMRSAYSNSPTYAAAFWNGDQLHTWDILDGLESTVYATISSSLSGMSLTHSDIGGYTTLNVDPRVSIKIGNRVTQVRLPILDKRARFVRQDRELFYRWMETAVFTSTAMYRTHEGSVPDENLQVWTDEDVSEKFAYFTKMHASLLNYRKLLAHEYQEHGFPLIRPLFLHYPFQNKAAVLMERLEFLLGPLLMVVPITSPGVVTLNQRIQEPRDLPDDDDDDDSDEGSLSPDEMEQPQVLDEEDLSSSSEDEHVVFQPRDASPSRSAKGRFLDNMRTFVRDGVVTTVNLVLGSMSVRVPDADWDKRESSVAPHSRIKSPPYSAPVGSLDDQESKRQVRRAVSSPPASATFPSRSDDDQGRTFPGGPPVLAPKELPKPRHGRVYLPPGTWVHLWSSQRITSPDSGMYITEDSTRLDCPIGQPAVFLREISDDEMTTIIRRGLDEKRVRGGEDWKYWLDSISGAQKVQMTRANQDALVKRALDKYRQLLASLGPFLEYVEHNRLK